MKPTSRYVFTLAGRVVSWKSSKKTCIVRSNMKTELMALKKARSKVVWLRSLLIDMPLFTNSVVSVCFPCDCQAVITRVKSKVYNGKSRQIQLRLRQLINNDVMSLNFVRSKRNLANPLTKPLARRLVSKTSRGIGLIPKLWHCG